MMRETSPRSSPATTPPLRRSDPRRVVIVGAGPAGLTAAYVLGKAGLKSVVLEKDQAVGGISKTVNYRGFLFDIGGHRFFTKVRSVYDLWRELLGEGLLRRKRLSRIYYRNRFFHYPLRPASTLFNLGVWNSLLISFSFLYARLFPFKDEETFEHWVCNRFGYRLYQTFFRSYTEKIWGIPCHEIRAEWAAQRIRGLNLLSAVKNALMRRRDGRATVRTLIEEFDYPRLGPGMMWEQAATIARQSGSEVLLESDVVGILWAGDRVEGLEVERNGRIELIHGTDFISSMPIKEAIAKFKPPVPDAVLQAANTLQYRDFMTIALIVDRPEIFPDNWLYIHDPNVKLGRIQNFKNWSPYMVPDKEKTCLGLEYFCFEGDSLWSMSDKELLDLGTRELEILGLVKACEVEDGVVVRMPKAYPIYDSTYRQSLTTVRQFLQELTNLQFVGRNGMHQYNNQDHSMLTAMLAVENILGASHDLWRVNEEQEYQETMIG